MKRKFLFFIFIFSFILFLGNPFSAQAQRQLEIDYPEITGWKPPPIVEDVNFPEYIIYIFNFAIFLCGFIVFGALVYGGFRWMTSQDNPTALSDAKSQVFASFLGIIILLSSYLILTTIDPQLISFTLHTLLKVEGTHIPGVYLSPNATFPSDEEIEGGEKVYYISFNVADVRGMTDKGDEIKSFRIVNAYTLEQDGVPVSAPLGFGYGVISHDRINYERDCEIYRAIESSDLIIEENNIDEPRSITIFQEVEESHGRVTVYEKPEFQEGGGADSLELELSPPGSDWQSLGDLAGKVESIKIEGNFLVALRGAGKCQVFTKSVPDLKGYLINKCTPTWWHFWARNTPCATHYHLFPTN